MVKEDVCWVLPVFMAFGEVLMLSIVSEGKYLSWIQGKRITDF